MLSPDITGESKNLFLLDSSIYTTITPYLVAGICGPNKKDYGGAALDIEIWSNDNSESIKHPWRWLGSLMGSSLSLAK